MKKAVSVVCLLIILALLATFAVGCSKKVKDGTYYEYKYDRYSDSFVRTGYRVTFENNATAFRYGSEVYGVYGEVKGVSNGLLLAARSDVTDALLGLNALKETDPETYALLKEYVSSVTLNQQLFRAENRLFSSADIELIKRTDQPYLTAVDGVYDFVNDAATRYRFEKGFVYVITLDDKGVATESEDAAARYTLQDGILTVIRIDSQGKDVVYEGMVQKVAYLFAVVSYPTEHSAENFAEDKYSQTIKEEMQTFAGKSFSVLATAFYAEE